MMPAIAQTSTNDSAFFQEVFAIEGQYVNDHALIREGEVWHLYYTVGSTSVHPWFAPGNEIRIAHATSRDLHRWNVERPAITIDSSRAFTRAHVYAPAVIERNRVYHMFYTMNMDGHGYGEEIRSAVSRDMFLWDASVGRAVHPDTTWCEYDLQKSIPRSCRDPFVMLSPEGGYVMYYVARLKLDSTIDHGMERACIAAATSTDLVHWLDQGPVLTRDVEGRDAYTWAHPESPCGIVKDGRTYLFWKEGNGTHYAISNDPLDFEWSEIHFLATSHASKIIEWNGRWYITSCSRAIADVEHRTSDRTRGLFIGMLEWSDLFPTLTVDVAQSQ
jgi:sucrose-6-phosphate hydrolase SacC (GH32 family)